jgi:hypothetical protein
MENGWGWGGGNRSSVAQSCAHDDPIGGRCQRKKLAPAMALAAENGGLRGLRLAGYRRRHRTRRSLHPGARAAHGRRLQAAASSPR